MAKRKIESETVLETEATQAPAVNVEIPEKKVHSLLNRMLRMIGWKALIVVLVLCVGWLGTAYFYHQYNSLRNDPQISAQLRAAQTIAELSSVIELPQNELPSFATVTDPSLLSGDVFFENAAIGDVLVVYTQARKVYLYRPSIKKVINVGAFMNDSAAVPAEAFDKTEN